MKSDSVIRYFRITQKDGTRIPKGTRSSNLDKWGLSKSTNILYITGSSGSGKSTLASKLKDSKTDVINLDLFTEQVGKQSLKERNKNFVNFLEANKFKSVRNANGEIIKGSLPKFENLISKFGQEQYFSERKVIVEGIQILDKTIQPNKGFFKDKPLIVMGTSTMKSYLRKAKRDRYLPTNPKDIKEFVDWYGTQKFNMEGLIDKGMVNKGLKHSESSEVIRMNGQVS